MSTVATLEASPAGKNDRAAPAWLGINHAATIFVSAFLLFQVQPLISKFILPWFGGSPAVWTTAMLCFQLLLFGGYLYAHLVTNRLGPKAQAILHATLLLIAITRLPIIPDPSWKPTDGDDPTWRILGLLAVTVGLPYFVLSTTGPLVQAWFSRAYAGRSPYRLYSLSNIGSLLALVSYPFVIEPTWNVVVQSWVWSGLFVLFALLCGISALWNSRPSPLPLSSSVAGDATVISANRVVATPTWARRLLWLGLPACASVMLLATTHHVCEDVAPVPLLWILPLSLYLLSFIICFDHQRWYQPFAFGLATLLAVLLVAGLSEFESLIQAWFSLKISFVQEIGIYLTMMFLVCMTCHGELVRLRPDPEHLTEFYLLISAGGALGGVFVSLVAPHVFSTFFEWKIALVAAFGIALVVMFLNFSFLFRAGAIRALLAVGTAIVGLYLIVQWQTSTEVPLDRARNFYGVVSVWDGVNDAGLRYRVLLHGRIAHGRQCTDDDKRRLPLAYYHENSGVGRAVKFLTADRDRIHVGIIGLGVGTMAAYAREGDRYTFYEINPEIKRIAETSFTYLKDCRVKPDVVMGDARLSLEREKSQQFDLLVVDAFSGDAIPAHLATQEAFAV